MIQRVSAASVHVDAQEIASISAGLLVYVAVAKGDAVESASKLASKTANLRVFADEGGKMNLSVLDTGGEVMVVSQFTLYGDVTKGNRPSFGASERPEAAEPLIESYVSELEAFGVSVKTGRFAADMSVSSTNDGPVTIIVEC